MKSGSRTNPIPIFAATAMMLPIGCRSERQVTVLKLAHALDVAHPVHMGMVFMGEKIKDYSNGKMRIDIYPGGRLVGLSFMAVAAIFSMINKYPVGSCTSLTEVMRKFLDAVPSLFLVLIVISGIIAGISTATEGRSLPN